MTIEGEEDIETPSDTTRDRRRPSLLVPIAVIAAAVAAIAFWWAAETAIGALLLLASLAATFLMGPATLGDPVRIGRLPDGITAADVKEHRKRHGGSISDAVRAVGEREDRGQAARHPSGGSQWSGGPFTPMRGLTPARARS